MESPNLHRLTDQELVELLEKLNRESAENWRRSRQIDDAISQLWPYETPYADLDSNTRRKSVRLFNLYYLRQKRGHAISRRIYGVRREIALRGRSLRLPSATPDLVTVMVDLAISIAGTGIYEAMRAIAISALTERRQVRIYSKTELAEQAQRLLASRLSLPFGKLTLKRIEISDGQKAVADFIADRQRYRVSIQMMRGVGVITRLQYEFEVRL